MDGFVKNKTTTTKKKENIKGIPRMHTHIKREREREREGGREGEREKHMNPTQDLTKISTQVLHGSKQKCPWTTNLTATQQ